MKIDKLGFYLTRSSGVVQVVSLGDLYTTYCIDAIDKDGKKYSTTREGYFTDSLTGIAKSVIDIIAYLDPSEYPEEYL